MPAPEGDQTGGARFRRGFFGGLVLEIEFEIRGDAAMGEPRRGWRRATEHDLRRVRWWREKRGLEPLI